MSDSRKHKVSWNRVQGLVSSNERKEQTGESDKATPGATGEKCNRTDRRSTGGVSKGDMLDCG